MDGQLLTPLPGHNVYPQIEIPIHIGSHLRDRSGSTAEVCGHMEDSLLMSEVAHENLRREVADASSLMGCHRIVHLAGRRRRSSERVTAHSEVIHPCHQIQIPGHALRRSGELRSGGIALHPILARGATGRTGVKAGASGTFLIQ